VTKSRLSLPSFRRLGRQDSNLGIVDPKSTALPLGHARSSISLRNCGHVAIITCCKCIDKMPIAENVIWIHDHAAGKDPKILVRARTLLLSLRTLPTAPWMAAKRVANCVPGIKTANCQSEPHPTRGRWGKIEFASLLM
jgi:hypothetical protein